MSRSIRCSYFWDIVSKRLRNRRKGAFYLILLGQASWNGGYSVECLRNIDIHYHLPPITYYQNAFYNGESDPGLGWTLAIGLAHVSRGETTLSTYTLRASAGTRMSNVYLTFPLLWDNLPKGRLVLHNLWWWYQIRSKDLLTIDEDALD